MTESAKTPRAGWQAAAAAVLTFALLEVSHRLLLDWNAYAELLQSLPRGVRYAEQPVRWTLICAAALWLTHRITPKSIPRELGLAAPILPALGFAFVATLPMLVPPLLLGRFNGEFDPFYALFGSFVWPLAEEIVFRGYVFRQLHRRAGWNFWLAAGASSLLFGAAHLGNAIVQQQPVAEQLGTVAMIAGLSVLGAWVFTRWDDNLWVMVALHGFMNLWWDVFHLADTPLGGPWANVLRLSVVPTAIAITIKRKPLAAWFSERVQGSNART